MQIKCGVDIIEISRIKESIESLGENFLKKIYTQDEIDYCESKGNAKYEHYAARFATKEAAFKAASCSISDKFQVKWQDFEVINEITGRPTVKIKFLDKDLIENIDVSISHCKEYAIANVTILYK